MKKYYFWIVLGVFTYAFIELLSYGGLFILNKYQNIQYEPADVISPQHADIINSFIEQKTKYWAYSPTLGWSIKNNGVSEFYQANSAGLRGSREYAFAAPPGVFRVSTFGDSFTFGADVRNDQTWQAMMEKMDPNLEVLNFGVPAFGLDQAYLRYMEEGRQYQSNIVLIGFMSENHFRTVNTYRPFYFAETGTPLTKPRFVIKEDQLFLIPNPIQDIQDYRRLLLHPKDVFPEIGIHDFYYQRRYTSGNCDWSPIVRLAKIMFQEVIGNSPHAEFSISHRFGYNEKSEAFQVTKKIFDEFYHASLKNKSIPIIIIFPRKTDLINYFALKIKLYEPLVEYFDSAGYQYIDLMDAFENSGYERLKLKDLFVPAHYSPLANSIVAKYLFRYINNMTDQETAQPVDIQPHSQAERSQDR